MKNSTTVVTHSSRLKEYPERGIFKYQETPDEASVANTVSERESGDEWGCPYGRQAEMLETPQELRGGRHLNTRKPRRNCGDEWNDIRSTAKLCYACLMRIRKLNHSVYQTQYHIVWGTKYRRKYLKDYVEPEFKKALYAVIKKYPTLYIHKLATDQDHVHLQIEIPPDLSIARVVQILKIETSIHLK